MVWPAALLSKLFRVRIGRAVCEVRWLQLDRERGEVKPPALEEHAGLPAALLGAEQQQRTLGVVGRGGAAWPRLRFGPQLLGLGADRTHPPRQSYSISDLDELIVHIRSERDSSGIPLA